MWLEDNSRSEIVTGFGIGISLQENSSYNVMIRNTAKRNFNGLEVSRGCQFNAVYDNNASENKHGIRLNENRNNLIFGNNFYNNDINAYENTSLNIWNTTIGNYYSDYRGKDENGDGIGDQPYSLPGPESKSFDHRPLIRPNREGDLGFSALREEARKYAIFGPAAEEIPLTRKVNGVMVISRGLPGTPPKWPESRPLDVTIPPFQKENGFLNDSSTEGAITFETEGAFYNPKMMLNRDIGVAMARALGLTDYLDALSASGIRGLRVAREAGVERVTLNDVSPQAYQLILKNVARNDLCCTVTCCERQCSPA